MRTRAGVPTVTSLDEATILKERRIELAFEGQYWFDLVRLSYYNPQGAIDAINNQTREQFTYDPSTGIETATPSTLIITPATISIFTLPIPANDQTADPKLLQAPVPYY